MQKCNAQTQAVHLQVREPSSRATARHAGRAEAAAASCWVVNGVIECVPAWWSSIVIISAASTYVYSISIM